MLAGGHIIASTSHHILLQLVREPLVHFLAAGALVFLAFGLVENKSPESPDITVTQVKIEQLASVFIKTWQRPPTEQELKALIDDFVKEEILVREAVRLGLDREDPVIRRRLRQKIDFMQEEETTSLDPAPGELEAYFAANRHAFEPEPQIALEQVFIDPQKHAVPATSASAMLQALQARPRSDISQLGDASMLPQIVQISPESTIAAIFGPDFAKQVTGLPMGIWSGPVKSDYGLHILRITGKQKTEEPKLADVREAVLRKWREAKQAEIAQQRLEALLKSYNVRIEAPTGPGQP